MTNGNRTRKGLVVSLLTIALASGVGAYGTFAYFNDTEQSTNNIFGAGTLDLSLSNPDGNVDGFISADKFAPGDSVSGDLVLKNVGNISSNDGQGHNVALDIAASLNQVDADGASTNMAEYLTISTLTYGGEDQIANVTDDNNNGRIDLDDLAQGSLTGLDDPGSAGKNLVLELTFDPSAGNDLQGDRVHMDLSFTLQQS